MNPQLLPQRELGIHVG